MSSVLSRNNLAKEIFTLILQLSEEKQKDLVAYLRNLISSEENLKKDKELKLVEENKIVLSPEEYKAFVNACFFEKWEVSQEDLDFARKPRRIKVIE